MLRPVFLLPCALLLAACANAAPGTIVDGNKFATYRKTIATGGGIQPDGAYQLNSRERQLDCKKLTGSIQVRILDLKDYRERHKPSVLAQATHGAAATIGKSSGADTEAEYARERARLDALNQALKEKGCKTVDIEAALGAPAGKRQ